MAREFVERTNASHFRRGDELPGRVLASGEPLWVADVCAVDWFERGHGNCEIRAAVAFPATVAKNVIAVVELFDVVPSGIHTSSL